MTRQRPCTARRRRTLCARVAVRQRASGKERGESVARVSTKIAAPLPRSGKSATNPPPAVFDGRNSIVALEQRRAEQDLAEFANRRLGKRLRAYDSGKVAFGQGDRCARSRSRPRNLRSVHEGDQVGPHLQAAVIFVSPSDARGASNAVREHRAGARARGSLRLFAPSQPRSLKQLRVVSVGRTIRCRRSRSIAF